MSTTYVTPTRQQLQQLDRAPSCPVCGGAMLEIDRMVESGSLYIWYECSTTDCDEQWLSKKPTSAS
jgi:hypothetical protein